MTAVSLVSGAGLPQRFAWRRENFRSRLTETQFATFASLSEHRLYRANGRISVAAVGLVTHGVARGEQYSDVLSEPVTSTTFYGPGDLIGLEEVFLPGGSESWAGADFRVHGAETFAVMQMAFATFRRFAAKEAAEVVMEEQAVRAKRALIDQARGAMSVRDRLGTFLLDLALRFGVRVEPLGVGLGLKVTQDQIAQAIGVSKPAVERELKWLRDSGYVYTHYRSMLLTPKFMSGGPRGTWLA